MKVIISEYSSQKTKLIYNKHQIKRVFTALRQQGFQLGHPNTTRSPAWPMSDVTGALEILSKF